MASNLLIDKSIMIIQHLFLLTGINIKVEKKTKFDKYRSLFIFYLNLIWLNLEVLGSIAQLSKGVAQHQKFTDLTYIAPYIFIGFLSSIKILDMFLYETTLELLITKMRKLEIEQINRTANIKTETIMKSEEKFLNRLLKISSIFYPTGSICYMACPVLIVLLNYIKTNEVILLLPVSACYPFDPYDIRLYPWVYLYQSWTVFLVSFFVNAADFMFYIICTYLCMQFRLLQYYIEHIISSEFHRGHNLKEIELKLIELIKWHQELLSCANLLENVYTRSTLFNFVTSSILICLAGFNLVENDVFLLSFISVLLMNLIQIFLLCFFGDLLTKSSMAVGDAVYKSKWHLADLSLSKTLLIVLTRSQTPCKLTACNYADVNLKAFMKICSTAWSYFALLQTLYSTPTQQE